MRQKWLLLVALLALPASAQAQTYYNTVQLTIDSTAAGIGFTSTDILIGSGHPQVNSASCVSNSSGGEFRYRVDGTAPTTSVGIPVPAGGALTFTNTSALLNFKGIRTGSTSAVLNCTLSDALIPANAPVGPVGGGGGGSSGSVTGSLATNGQAAAANRLGTLPAVVNNSAPSYTDGRDAALSVTTGGAQRVMITNAAGTASTIATDQTYGTSTYTEATTTGPLVGAVRTDTPAALANTTNEVAPLAVSALNGLYVASADDPCRRIAKTVIPINIASATTTEITPSLAGASNYYYVCSLNLVSASANNMALVDDDSDNCGSVTAGMAGGTTAASGWNFAANGGMTFGNGAGTIFKTNGTNRVICLVTSGAGQVSGAITVVAAP